MKILNFPKIKCIRLIILVNFLASAHISFEKAILKLCTNFYYIENLQKLLKLFSNLSFKIVKKFINLKCLILKRFYFIQWRTQTFEFGGGAQNKKRETNSGGFGGRSPRRWRNFENLP